MTSSLYLGLLVIALSWASFGSFAVPIKSPAVVAANVHPLIYQTYKTVVVFATAWLILFFEGWTFSPWGIAGAAIWIPSGITAVIAVRLIGVSLAQGIWGSLCVPISFFWGAVVFGNPVHSWPLSILGVVLIIAGTIGMTWSTKADPKSADHVLLASNDSETDLDISPTAKSRLLPCLSRKWEYAVGFSLAVVTGFLGGSMYVPLHYTGKVSHEPSYVVSFGIGAAIVNIALLILYFIACKIMREPFPDFHFKVTWRPGLLTGLLWAIGNMCSTFAVIFLGQAIGGTATYCSLLVAGLWGIFYYQEIQRPAKIAAWFISAGVTLGGAVVLILFG